MREKSAKKKNGIQKACRQKNTTVKLENKNGKKSNKILKEI